MRIFARSLPTAFQQQQFVGYDGNLAWGLTFRILLPSHRFSPKELILFHVFALFFRDRLQILQVSSCLLNGESTRLFLPDLLRRYSRPKECSPRLFQRDWGWGVAHMETEFLRLCCCHGCSPPSLNLLTRRYGQIQQTKQQRSQCHAEKIFNPGIQRRTYGDPVILWLPIRRKCLPLRRPPFGYSRYLISENSQLGSGNKEGYGK